MHNNLSCIEILPLLNGEDYGFFNEIMNVAQQIPITKRILPAEGKPKSIIISDHKLYVCQPAKFPYVKNIIELYICYDDKNQTFQACNDVPEATCYRVASPYLWIYLMAILGFANESSLDCVGSVLIENRSILYDSYTHDFINVFAHRPASLKEMLFALSAELKK